MHQIDVLASHGRQDAIAIEVKLGITKPGAAARIRFQKPCKQTHGGTRFQGNILAVLQRLFVFPSSVDAVQVENGPNRVHLRRHWILICRKQLQDFWIDLVDNSASVYVFEDLVKLVGPAEFNSAVRSFLGHDWARDWGLV